MQKFNWRTILEGKLQKKRSLIFTTVTWSGSWCWGQKRTGLETTLQRTKRVEKRYISLNQDQTRSSDIINEYVALPWVSQKTCLEFSLSLLTTDVIRYGEATICFSSIKPICLSCFSWKTLLSYGKLWTWRDPNYGRSKSSSICKGRADRAGDLNT